MKLRSHGLSSDVTEDFVDQMSDYCFMYVYLGSLFVAVTFLIINVVLHCFVSCQCDSKNSLKTFTGNTIRMR